MATSFAGACTVMVNMHRALRCRASVAVHVTDVDPIDTLAGLAGLHAVVIGLCPPVTVGGGYVTTAD